VAEILSFGQGEQKRNFIRSIWESFKSLGTSHKILILTAILIVSAIPFIVSNRQIFNPQAAENKNDLSETLTLSALNTNRIYQSKKDQESLNNLKTALLVRKEKLSEIIEKNPEEFLKVKFDSKVKAQFPEEVVDLIEQNVTLEGTLEVLHADDFEKKISKNYFFLKSGPKKYSLHFVGSGPALLTGSQIKILGIKLGDKIALRSSSDKDLRVLKSESKVLSASTERKVAIILFNFTNNRIEPFSPEAAENIVFNDERSARAYYQETSFNLLNLSGDAFGWYTIDYDNTNCSSNYRLWSEAAKQKAVLAGVDLSPYDNFIYVLPETLWCPGPGWGYIGGNESWVLSHVFRLYTIGHELGHNLGAGHSSTYRCIDESGNKVVISNNCTHYEYGDIFDIMGDSENHLNNFHKGRAGWYNPSNRMTVTSNGIYGVRTLENPSDGVIALRVPRRNAGGYFYIEYRQPSFFDNFSTSSAVVNGLSIRHSYDYNQSFNTHLLDTKPFTDSFVDSALGIGETFFDPISNTGIKAISKSSASAQVQIIFEQQGCIRANPTVSIDPLSQWGMPGEKRSFWLVVSNNDSIECPPSIFKVNPTLADNLSQSPNDLSIDLNPGSTKSTLLEITAGSNALEGIYSFEEAVFNESSTEHSASASANFNVFIMDSDSDGFSDSLENYLGTDPNKKCADNPGVNNEPGPDAWPLDFDDNQKANTLDIGKFVFVLNKRKEDAGFSARYDFNQDGVINTVDVGKFVPQLNKSCTQ
jgi:hypothetical protein